MNYSIEIIKKPRLMLLEILKDLTTDQLNEIPAGFNNNIIWNLGHMVSAQQGLCYARAGLAPVVEDKYYTPYRPGTKPEGFVEVAEVDEIKTLMLSTLDRLEADNTEGIFSNYTPVTTRYGVTLANIDEAISFVPFHEGLHIGAIMALNKFVKK